MHYLCHRGFWTRKEEQNTLASFARAFELGFGIETDLRDSGSRIVISHDLPRGDEPTFAEVLDLYAQYPKAGILALNIKADGLQVELARLMEGFDPAKAFVFDMSVPDTLHYIKGNFTTFTRQSEYEPDPPLYQDADGIWLDCFVGEAWISPENITKHLEAGKQVAVVSPELHKRDRTQYWETLRQNRTVVDSKAMLCTDLPLEAKAILER